MENKYKDIFYPYEGGIDKMEVPTVVTTTYDIYYNYEGGVERVEVTRQNPSKLEDNLN